MKKERLTDFSPNELPANRWSLFWDIVRHQSRALIATSLLETLFALPLFIDYFVFSFLVGSLRAQSASPSGIFALLFYGCLTAIPCFMVLFLGLTGAAEITKKLAFLEGTLGVSSFYMGFRKNWKAGLGIGFLYGASFALALLGSVYLLFFQGSHPLMTGFGIGLLLYQFLIVNSLSHYALSQEALYENTFGATLKNSFIFAHVKLPLNVAWTLLSPGIFIILLAINDVTSYVGVGLFALLNSYGLLVWTLYAHAVYDRYINAAHHPELVGKGLHKKED